MNLCNEISIGRLIYRTTQTMTLHGEKLLKPYDLTAEQFHLLKNISENKALSQSQLCEIVQKSAANVTRILDRLEKKNFVKREKNPADRRSIHIFLTVQGKELVDEVSSLFQDFSELLTKGISDQERALLAIILQRIQDNLSTPTKKWPQ
ncbi:MAG: MarR family transcriptional regulator [Proteobacteria bacterium]|nr:MarR family transcriptional regulator [Pseudomonadota bacterium]MBU1418365.1 MarR family transcriptional regulator [Pseudomonadota bacterium]MBU1455377.1 MarR family transcriptional regulator [Pseudomonadota bacterium]